MQNTLTLKLLLLLLLLLLLPLLVLASYFFSFYDPMWINETIL